jgi:hypothetical protein
MHRSVGLACLAILLASALGATACTEAGGGRAVPGDASADAGDVGDAPSGDPDATPDRLDAAHSVQPSTGPAGPLLEACAIVADARCKMLDGCTAGVGLKLRYGSEQACLDGVAAECASSPLLTASDVTTFDATTAKRCADAIVAEGCAAFAAEVLPAACALAGSRPVGAACGVGAQCASTYCRQASPSTCGTCAATPSSGARCSSSADCGDRGGLTCTNGQCTTLGALGDACSAEDRCAEGLSCLTPDAGTFGTCVESAAFGKPCDATGSVAAACNRPCGALTATGLTGCAAGGLCAPVGGGATQRCVMPVGDGEACSLTAGPPCTAPARCVGDSDASVTGRCVRLDPSTCN